MFRDDATGLESSGIFYVTHDDQRPRLTRGGRLAIWAFVMGALIGFLLTHNPF